MTSQSLQRAGFSIPAQVAMRQMILAADENDRKAALDKLLVMQREDESS